ncbi:hypothetical protein DH2020_047518 [Rehmannia glutinosa]|uniref:F-box domain-containing protein n=1 Tax=Rehmannia glutinosa TaxID=99300 RepID=A0ABR0U8E4_REHGL
MDIVTCSEQQHTASSDSQHRKRKRNHKGVDDALSPVVIDNLPDDVLIAILSRMSRKEAARTSVLSRKWRYLWLFTSGTLELDDKSIYSSGTLEFVNYKDKLNKIDIKRRKFIAYVNRILELHQGLGLDGLIIRFAHLRVRSLSGRRPSYIDNWIYFAMQKEVKMFELNFSMSNGYHPYYEFPNVDMLLSRSNDVKFGFGSLKSLRLVGVDIKDEVVQYFLASCPYLEQLCIRGSYVTKNLKVVDPLPNLKVLEISDCRFIYSLEVSVVNLVSCTYEGRGIILPFKEIPNLSELTLGGDCAQSFIYEPYKHSSYSFQIQLVKLALNIQWERFSRDGLNGRPELPRLYSLKRLELNVKSSVGRSLHFFTSLIKASPLLNEFRIKNYECYSGSLLDQALGSFKAHQLSLSVKMSGYIGCSTDKTFVLRLLKIAPSLETVTIDTESEYYEQKPWDCATRCKEMDPCMCSLQETGPRTRIEAKKRAEQLKTSFPSKTMLVIM